MDNDSLFPSPVILLVVSIATFLKSILSTSPIVMTDTVGYNSGYHDQLLIGLLALTAYLILIIQSVMAILLHSLVVRDVLLYLSIVIPYFPFNYTNSKGQYSFSVWISFLFYKCKYPLLLPNS